MTDNSIEISPPQKTFTFPERSSGNMGIPNFTDEEFRLYVTAHTAHGGCFMVQPVVEQVGSWITAKKKKIHFAPPYHIAFREILARSVP